MWKSLAQIILCYFSLFPFCLSGPVCQPYRRPKRLPWAAHPVFYKINYRLKLQPPEVFRGFIKGAVPVTISERHLDYYAAPKQMTLNQSWLADQKICWMPIHLEYLEIKKNEGGRTFDLADIQENEGPGVARIYFLCHGRCHHVDCLSINYGFIFGVLGMGVYFAFVVYSVFYRHLKKKREKELEKEMEENESDFLESDEEEELEYNSDDSSKPVCFKRTPGAHND